MMNKKFHNVGRCLLNAYIFVLFLVMPLYIKNYNTLGYDKWKFFAYVSYGFEIGRFFIPGFLLLIGLCLIIEVVIFKYDIKYNKVDLFILLFLIVVFISGYVANKSYFISDTSQIVLGYPGWYMGQAAQFGFVLIYFYTKQYWENNKLFFNLVLIVSSIIFFFAILNRFSIDVFGFWKTLSSEAKLRNVSTLGNINWYTCYLVLHIPISAYFFLYTNNKIGKLFYGLAFAIAICTLVSNGSDSGFLALACIMYLLIKDEDNVSWLIFIGSLACCILGIFQRVFIDVAYIPSTLSRLSTLSIVPWLLLIISIVLIVKSSLYKYFKKIVVIGLPIGVLSVIVYIILNSFNILPSFISSDNEYLYFNDAWGNNRGVIWRMGLSSLMNFVKDHLYVLFIGCGPDQYYNMVYKYQYYELVQLRHGLFASCAHNEFINTLCNYGVLGFVGLYGFWFILLKGKANNKYEKMLKLMIIAYLVNSIVSIQQIEAAPLLFTCAGMLEAERTTIKIYKSSFDLLL